MIDLKQALLILEGGDWCGLRFITANVLKGSGGMVIELPKCRIAKNNQSNTTKTLPTDKPGVNGGLSRNPNHHSHFTRNVELPNRSIRKVHPILITHINNQRVI